MKTLESTWWLDGVDHFFAEAFLNMRCNIYQEKASVIESKQDSAHSSKKPECCHRLSQVNTPETPRTCQSAVGNHTRKRVSAVGTIPDTRISSRTEQHPTQRYVVNNLSTLGPHEKERWLSIPVSETNWHRVPYGSKREDNASKKIVIQDKITSRKDLSWNRRT